MVSHFRLFYLLLMLFFCGSGVQGLIRSLCIISSNLHTCYGVLHIYINPCIGLSISKGEGRGTK